MTAQLDLFSSAPKQLRAVYADDMRRPAPETVERIIKQHATGRLVIELAQHDDGQWMWATQHQTPTEGNSYAVMPKWGNFADCRNEALHMAVMELRTRLERTEYGLRMWAASWLQQVAP
jgi:hypothetical protein